MNNWNKDIFWIYIDSTRKLKKKNSKWNKIKIIITYFENIFNLSKQSWGIAVTIKKFFLLQKKKIKKVFHDFLREHDSFGTTTLAILEIKK